MTAKGIRALHPRYLKLVHILRRNVGQVAVTRQSKVTTRGRPLVGISHTLQLFLVGIHGRRLTREPHRHSDDGAGQDT